MIYIESVYADNWMSWPRLDVKFEKGYNALVGPSDKGKSAILKAIRFNLENKAPGDFITYGRDTAVVGVRFINDETGDRFTIERGSGKKTNYYKIIRDGMPDQVFDKFGKSIPDEVLELTTMSHILVGKEKVLLNYAAQMDQPFFISENSLARAAVVGGIAKTTTVDMALDEADSDLRATKKTIKEAEGDLSRQQSELDSYGFIEAEEALLAEVEQFITAAEVTAQSRKSIQTLIQKISEQSERMEGLRTSIERNKVRASATEFVSAASDSMKSLSKIRMLIRGIQENEARLEHSKAIIARKSSIDDATVIIEDMYKYAADLKKISTIVQRMNTDMLRLYANKEILAKGFDNAAFSEVMTSIDAKQKEVKAIKRINTNLSELNDRLVSVGMKRDKAVASFARSMKEYTDAIVENKQCPTCMTPLGPDDVERITKSI